MAARFCETLFVQEREDVGSSFFKFDFLFYAEDAVIICLYDQQFFHLISGFSILRIGRFFLCNQFGVFGIDLFYGGQLFQAGIIKKFFAALWSKISLSCSARNFLEYPALR